MRRSEIIVLQTLLFRQESLTKNCCRRGIYRVRGRNPKEIDGALGDICRMRGYLREGENPQLLAQISLTLILPPQSTGAPNVSSIPLPPAPGTPKFVGAPEGVAGGREAVAHGDPSWAATTF
jgi:hypothetical protein